MKDDTIKTDKIPLQNTLSEQIYNRLKFKMK